MRIDRQRKRAGKATHTSTARFAWPPDEVRSFIHGDGDGDAALGCAILNGQSGMNSLHERAMVLVGEKQMHHFKLTIGRAPWGVVPCGH
jgi:hypothetical protein